MMRTGKEWAECLQWLHEEDNKSETLEQELLRLSKFEYKELFMCDICGELKAHLKRCSQCKKKWYCSKKCQREDWNKHKKICLNKK